MGFGNPGKEYENTRHNAGFIVVDEIAKMAKIDISKNKFDALVGEYMQNGEKIMLVKPQTYMNLSGESVRQIVDFYKVDLEDVIVIYDDIDIELGKIRIRPSGSPGTHNGMRNIIAELKQTNFARVRVGFKPTENMQIPLINYVLSGIKESDREIFNASIKTASLAGYDFACGKPIQEIMQRYNTKSE